MWFATIGIYPIRSVSYEGYVIPISLIHITRLAWVSKGRATPRQGYLVSPPGWASPQESHPYTLQG